MKQKDVIIGAFYAIRHFGDSANSLSVIRIDGLNRFGGYDATKMTTNRTIRIRSAAKLRKRVERDEAGNWKSYKEVKYGS